MTPVGKWFRNFAEKFAKKFYEGPEPPERLRDAVVRFANDFPKATRNEWVQFAAAFAEEAYRSGYVRGFEYTERTHDWRPDIPPEVIADWMDPDWKSDGRGISIQGLPTYVPGAEDRTEEEVLRAQVEEVMISTARRR